MAALAEGLATNQILLSLLLSSNEIRPAGLEALASSLLRNKALLELDLSYNPAGHPNAVRDNRTPAAPRCTVRSLITVLAAGPCDSPAGVSMQLRLFVPHHADGHAAKRTVLQLYAGSAALGQHRARE